MGKKVDSRDADETRLPLQAIVLADSFTQRFRPVTLQCPKVLLPLVNVPMLNYTLEWLASAGVDEVFVVCCAHSEQIEDYLRKVGWLVEDSDEKPGAVKAGVFKVRVLVSLDCTTVGDALRVVDQRNVIRSDFVLVSGDVVSNMSLTPVLAAHRLRRKTDKQAIMTIVTKQMSSALRRERLSSGGSLTVALDSDSGQLLMYDPAGQAGRTVSPHIKLCTKTFKQRNGMQIRSDVLDCHIDICAPEVLVDFRENFDYQHVRRDFVGGVLIDEEMGNKIYTYQLPVTEYAVRVHNLRTYDAVSRDIITRWTFPIVPDNSIVPSLKFSPGYQYLRGNNYREVEEVAAAGGKEGGGDEQQRRASLTRITHLSRSATIGPNTVLAAGCRIGDRSVVRNCVLGAGCVIGSDCVLEGCYLQAGVKVNDQCQLTSAMLCDGVTLHQGAVLEEGVILSYNVVIGPGFRVRHHTRISLLQQSHDLQTDDSDEEIEYRCPSEFPSGLGPGVGGLKAAMQQAQLDAARAGTGEVNNQLWEPAAVGPGGAGFMWQRSSESEEEWKFSIAPSKKKLMRGVSLDWPADDASDSEDELGPSRKGGRPGGASGKKEEEDEDDDDDDEDEDPERVFLREVTETFLRCVRLGYEQDNAVVELNALKLAEDRTFADLARYIFTALLGLALPALPDTAPENRPLYASALPETDKELLTALRSRVKTWGNLLRRFLKNKDDQVEVLLTFEEYVLEEGVYQGSGGARYMKPFVQCLQLLYNDDVLTEDAILTWADEKKDADEEDKKLVKLAAPFIQWLQEAEEDSSEEEDENDE